MYAKHCIPPIFLVAIYLTVNDAQTDCKIPCLGADPGTDPAGFTCCYYNEDPPAVHGHCCDSPDGNCTRIGLCCAEGTICGLRCCKLGQTCSSPYPKDLMATCIESGCVPNDNNCNYASQKCCGGFCSGDGNDPAYKIQCCVNADQKQIPHAFCTEPYKCAADGKCIEIQNKCLLTNQKCDYTSQKCCGGVCCGDDRTPGAFANIQCCQDADYKDMPGVFCVYPKQCSSAGTCI